uniref:hypothetical protein n=1 Tax=Pseudomonas sp. RW407 TaxID=2202894 RepID=UPI0011B3F3DE|nr:hypothetical protein [Pseudomonas sp. RW407]
MEEVTLEHEGKTYSATYVQVDDDLIVCLPDGSERCTTLRGLNPEQAAKSHLRGYIGALTRKR